MLSAHGRALHADDERMHPAFARLLAFATRVRALELVPAALALLVFGLLIVRYWPFTVDDTYITLRYAANLAAGQGPSWNVRSQPIEGYTSFLWMLLMAVPHALHLDAVLAAKITGVLCMLAA